MFFNNKKEKEIKLSLIKLRKKKEQYCKKWRELNCKGCPYCIQTNKQSCKYCPNVPIKDKEEYDAQHRFCTIAHVIHIENY